MRATKQKHAKPKAMTKAQMASEVANQTGLTKAQVQDVFQAQSELLQSELKAGRPVALFGLKVSVQRKGPTAARQGRNPATGETITIKARPARNIVKVRALKALKDAVI